MSTAIAEPPVVEPPATPEPPTPAARADVANSFLRPKVNVDGNITQAPDLSAKKPAPAPTPEPAKTPEPPAPDPKEVSMAELRKARDEARQQLEAERAERAKYLAELEEYKKRPDPKEYIEKLTAAEREREEIRQQLRAASLERDPSFKREYHDKINANAKLMLDFMVASGADQAEATKAVQSWDENRFAEFAEAMQPGAKMKFQAAWMEAERVEQERRAALANADVEWTKRQQAAEAAQKQQAEQQQQFLIQEKESLFKELFTQEGLVDKKELQEAARQAVEASFTYPPKELMRQVASARLLAEGVKSRDAELTTLRSEMATLKQQLQEQEQFIKSQNGGVARISPSNPGEVPVDKKAMAEFFLNPPVKHT